MTDASALLGQGVGGGEMQEKPGQAPGAEAAPPESFPAKMLAQAQGRFTAVDKEVKKISDIRRGLDKLGEKADAVTSDDVLDEMATLVAKGADPKMFVAMMAGNAQEGIGPMPPQGQPLQKWLEGISEELLAPYEAQLKQADALARHQLGVAAMHHLVDNHARAQGASQGDPMGATAAPASPLLH